MCLKTLVTFLVISGLVYVEAGQKCTGNPRMYRGKRCASTTRYHDGRKGACGCGPDNNDSQFRWNAYSYVTAPSQHLFDAGGKAWCGWSCGKCVKLTTTGGYVDGQGGPARADQSVVFMTTNLCPNEWPNLRWCSQSRHNSYRNKYGYGEHFDLEDGYGQIRALGWNNPEVTWEWTDCNAAHRSNSKTPSYGMFHQCYCGRHPGGGKK